MNIAATQFTLDTGSFEIYLSGCRHRCSEECHNKELWDFNIGKLYNKKLFIEIKEKILEFDDLVDSISILGRRTVRSKS